MQLPLVEVGAPSELGGLVPAAPWRAPGMSCGVAAMVPFVYLPPLGFASALCVLSPLPSCLDCQGSWPSPDGMPGMRRRTVPVMHFPSGLWSRQPQWPSGKEVGGDSSNLGGGTVLQRQGAGLRGLSLVAPELQDCKKLQEDDNSGLQGTCVPRALQTGALDPCCRQERRELPSPQWVTPQKSSLGATPEDAWLSSGRLAHVRPGLNACYINVLHRAR